MQKEKIVIVGGGAAGFFAGINGSKLNPNFEWIILESSKNPLHKVKISGGGRCNVTHNCFDPQVLSSNYPRGKKELLGPFYKFQAKDTVNWFADRDITLIAEKDGRMFPSSNKSSSIIDTFMQEQRKYNLCLKTEWKVQQIESVEDGFCINIKDQKSIHAKYLILCTGSSRLGHQLASSFGHTIIPPAPSLFTFKIKHALLEDMMGQSFQKISLKLSIVLDKKKHTFTSQGPLLITHWGLSGPAALKLSAFAARQLMEAKYQAHLVVKWLDYKSKNDILNRLKEFKNLHPKENQKKSPFEELSKKFWEKIINYCNVSQSTKWQELSNQSLDTIAKTLFSCPMMITGKGIFKDEFVTAGGVDCKEVNFKSMESKKVPGLFFAGEILNIDGITGGFNFQNAWTTAWIASNYLSTKDL